MDDLTFKFEQNGEEYRVVKILASENMPHKYVIYTDGSEELFASRYKILNGSIILTPIEDDKEWEYIDNELEGVINE